MRNDHLFSFTFVLILVVVSHEKDKDNAILSSICIDEILSSNWSDSDTSIKTAQRSAFYYRFD